jgi:thiamine biosynthesis lipoprotein
LVSDRIVKETPGVVLDFNAIAQGYTVDVLASFLESKGIRDYLVEVGGEIRAKGEKLDKTPWAVGIEKPDDTPTEGRSLQTGVGLKDQALATSGNYKKYYEEDGRRYTHIIDPVSGYPTKNNLLSATVVAGDCMTADAYATAFIVMGLERSRKFLSEHKDLQLEVFFIYDDGGVWKTYSSEDFPSFTSQIP